MLTKTNLKTSFIELLVLIFLPFPYNELLILLMISIIILYMFDKIKEL